MGADAAAPDATALQALRPRLLQFARLQLHDPSAAEDVVQEALLAALQNADSFAGRSSWRTWVFSILRRKIIDEIRRRTREPLASAEQARFQEAGDDVLTAFDERGFWLRARRPQRWADAEAALQDAQFWEIFEACLDHLPPAQGRAFSMRELLELEVQEICEALGISSGNLYVMLHRARLRLRACLEARWFAEAGS